MTTAHKIIRFEKDTTINLPCRENDLLIWMRGQVTDEAARMRDFWRLSPGDSVKFTNRFDDLPEWFTLCTFEVENMAAFKMHKLIKAGYSPVFEPAVGTNIWRVLTGDRIVWMGESRSDYESDNGILGIFDFRECAVVLGEPGTQELSSWASFGATPAQLLADVANRCSTAVKAVGKMGMPRSIEFEWRLGW